MDPTPSEGPTTPSPHTTPTRRELFPADAADARRPVFPSRRSAVLGTAGMVATSQPLAAQAGLAILEAGGNAFDAAVATAAALAVVEPTGGGLGGDAFALVFLAAYRRVEALNGSGRSPQNLTRAEVESLGGIPPRSAHSVTVPGAVRAWEDLLRRHGRLGLEAALAPAVALAAHGYPVSELIARAWSASASLLARHPSAARHYQFKGRAPATGDLVRLPALARTLQAIAAEGADAFYQGELGEDIVRTVVEAGGRMTITDLEKHGSTWETPLAVDFEGLRVWECPPNGQGLAALVALGAAREPLVADEAWGSFSHLHLLVEAMRCGFGTAGRWVADPEHVAIPITTLLADDHLSSLRASISPTVAAVQPRVTPVGTDTAYLAVVDSEGNACSFIQSNYMGFGSGLVTERGGVPLQNRGAGFVLDPDHPNDYAPRKRPYHTIIPGLATTPDKELALVFGVMGGFMQPQGHLQVLTNLARFGMDPQRALDAPRFQILEDGRLALEEAIESTARAALRQAGHRLVSREESTSLAFGGGQIIAMSADGVRIGGSDPRKDGCVEAQLPGRFPSIVWP